MINMPEPVITIRSYKHFNQFILNMLLTTIYFYSFLQVDFVRQHKQSIVIRVMNELLNVLDVRDASAKGDGTRSLTSDVFL